MAGEIKVKDAQGNIVSITEEEKVELQRRGLLPGLPRDVPVHEAQLEIIEAERKLREMFTGRRIPGGGLVEEIGEGVAQIGRGFGRIKEAGPAATEALSPTTILSKLATGRGVKSVSELGRSLVEGAKGVGEIGIGGFRVLGAHRIAGGEVLGRLIGNIIRKVTGDPRSTAADFVESATAVASTLPVRGVLGRTVTTVGERLPIVGIPFRTARNLPRITSALKEVVRSGLTGRSQAREVALGLRRGPPIGATEDLAGIREALGRGVLRETTKAAKEAQGKVSKLIEEGLSAIPSTATRVPSSIREVILNEIGSGGVVARVGAQAQVAGIVRKGAKAVGVPVGTGRIAAIAKDLGVSQKILVEAVKGKATARELDAFRTAMREALDVARKAGDFNKMRVLRQLRAAASKDLMSFSDEFPKATENINKGLRLSRAIVAPFFRGEAPTARLLVLLRKRPSEFIAELGRRSPEEVRNLRRALKNRPGVFKEIGDRNMDIMIGNSFNLASGQFEPARFAQQILNPKNIDRLKVLYPDRFKDLITTAKGMQEVGGVLASLEQRGRIAQAFGVVRMVRGAMRGDPTTVLAGGIAILAPRAFANLASTAAGLKVLSQAATAKPGTASGFNIARRLFNAANAATREAERLDKEADIQLVEDLKDMGIEVPTASPPARP